jgi:hypothetical protein
VADFFLREKYRWLISRTKRCHHRRQAIKLLAYVCCLSFPFPPDFNSTFVIDTIKLSLDLHLFHLNQGLYLLYYHEYPPQKRATVWLWQNWIASLHSVWSDQYTATTVPSFNFNLTISNKLCLPKNYWAWLTLYQGFHFAYY